MSLTYQRLIPYLSYAFDHFSKEPESAFNFVKVAFRENPIPDDFGGGILQLLIAMKDYSISKSTAIEVLKEVDIFKAATPMIAGAIMLDSTRHNKIGKQNSMRSNMAPIIQLMSI